MDRQNHEYDYRHRMGTSVPRGEEGNLNVARCEGCRTLNTEWELQMLGVCRKCGSTRFRGASPSALEWARIQWLYLTRNWRSRGWRSFEERQAIRAKVVKGAVNA